ncbi:hypothetical protein ABEB36_010784 [Hypothenemus hampei]|uniref:Uncharacterized protein n=1 Tax=Hypothenemus hampei TaxID=57062 RepID=A0ABD1EFU0_HYPHA
MDMDMPSFLGFNNEEMENSKILVNISNKENDKGFEYNNNNLESLFNKIDTLDEIIEKIYNPKKELKKISLEILENNDILKDSYESLNKIKNRYN